MAVSIQANSSTPSSLLLGFDEFFGAMYRYREYLKQSVARDLRKKYKRTSLGYLWSMLNPLLMMTVLTVVFTKLLPRVENYAVYLYCGLIGWQYFQGTVSSSLNSIRSNMRIVEQVPIPKFLFILSTACSNIVNLFLTAIPLFVIMVVLGHPLHWTVILLPIALIPLIVVTLGFSLLFGVLNVFFEDMTHLCQILLRAWFYLTPVLFGPDMMPPHVAKWLQLNPLYYPILSIRNVCYNGIGIDWGPFLLSLASGLAILAVSLWVFRKADDKFIYFV